MLHGGAAGAKRMAGSFDCHRTMGGLASPTITICDHPDEAHAALKVAASAPKGRRTQCRRSKALSESVERALGRGFEALSFGLSGSNCMPISRPSDQGLDNEDIDALFKRSDEQGKPGIFQNHDRHEFPRPLKPPHLGFSVASGLWKSASG